jgi:hypothetical protein
MSFGAPFAMTVRLCSFFRDQVKFLLYPVLSDFRDLCFGKFTGVAFVLPEEGMKMNVGHWYNDTGKEKAN